MLYLPYVWKETIEGAIWGEGVMNSRPGVLEEISVTFMTSQRAEVYTFVFNTQETMKDELLYYPGRSLFLENEKWDLHREFTANSHQSQNDIT